MKHILFNPKYLSTDQKLFDDTIEFAPLIFFHGTSSVFEVAIDKQGLRNNISVKKDDLQKIASVYDKYHWAGTDRGGFPVLLPYSLGHDYNSSDSSPIYFAEFSARAITYSKRDFVGGEKVRAFIRAYEDIVKLSENIELRDAHYEKMRNEHSHLEGSPYYPEFVKPIDVDYLNELLKSLKSKYEDCQQIKTAYKYGVVYAVRFSLEDLPYLKYDHSMGLKASADISLNKIIAKVHIPADLEFNLTLGESMREKIINKKQSIDQLLAPGNIGNNLSGGIG